MLEDILDSEELCPAPAVKDLVPNTIEKIEEYLEQHPKDQDARFLFANLLLQANLNNDAKTQFRALLNVDGQNNHARCNFAIALRRLGEAPEAERELKKVILKDPDQLLAYLHLALIEQAKNNNNGAIGQLKKALRIDPNNIKALCGLAILLKESHKEIESRAFAERVLGLDPENRSAHAIIGHLEFLKGKVLYEQGDLLSAFSSWRETMAAHPVAFTASVDIVREKSLLEKQFRDTGVLEEATNLFAKGFSNNELEQRDYYDLFTLFFFSVGLMPEVYADPEQLKQEFDLWKERFSSVNSYPYAKFRMAVLYCYCGQLNDAFEFFTACRDEIPSTKSESLKLTDAIAFTQKIRRLTKSEDEEESTSVEGDWSIFEDTFQRKAWQRSGLAPEEAMHWYQLELSPQQARQWKKAEIRAEEAKQWKEAGFIVAKEALRFRNAGFSASEARTWIDTFPHPVELALQCRSIGFTDPEEAAQWLRVLMFPSEAWQWRELGFSPADALLYRSDGISDPHVASKNRAKKSH